MIVSVTSCGRVDGRLEVELALPPRLAGHSPAREGVGDIMTNGEPQAAVQ